MRTTKLAGVLALTVAFAACSKTDDGKIVVDKPVDVDVKTKQDTFTPPRVEMKKDTVNTPVVGTQKETLVVNKPVVGTKKTEISVPTVKKP